MSAPGLLPETSITTSTISMYRSIPNPILRRCRACQRSVIGICAISWRPLRRLIRSLRSRTNRPRPTISCGPQSTARSRSSAEAIRDVPGRKLQRRSGCVVSISETKRFHHVARRCLGWSRPPRRNSALSDSHLFCWVAIGTNGHAETDRDLSAFGAKRTCREGRKRFGLTLLTQNGHGRD